jgi:hypothetical protein
MLYGGDTTENRTRVDAAANSALIRFQAVLNGRTQVKGDLVGGHYKGLVQGNNNIVGATLPDRAIAFKNQVIYAAARTATHRNSITKNISTA